MTYDLHSTMFVDAPTTIMYGEVPPSCLDLPGGPTPLAFVWPYRRVGSSRFSSFSRKSCCQKWYTDLKSVWWYSGPASGLGSWGAPSLQGPSYERHIVNSHGNIHKCIMKCIVRFHTQLRSLTPVLIHHVDPFNIFLLQGLANVVFRGVCGHPRQPQHIPGGVLTRHGPNATPCGRSRARKKALLQINMRYTQKC